MQLTYGEYGGRFVPETLIPALDELEQAWNKAKDDPAFALELDELGRAFGGRPTPLMRAERFAVNRLAPTIWPTLSPRSGPRRASAPAPQSGGRPTVLWIEQDCRW